MDLRDGITVPWRVPFHNDAGFGRSRGRRRDDLCVYRSRILLRGTRGNLRIRPCAPVRVRLRTLVFLLAKVRIHTEMNGGKNGESFAVSFRVHDGHIPRMNPDFRLNPPPFF